MSATRLDERLTKAQNESLLRWRAEALAVGTCTDPADRPRAEAAIAEMYGLIQQPAPRFIWCDSPATSTLLIHLLKDKKLASLRASLGASLWDSLWDSLRDSLGASLRDSLWASLRASLWASLWASLRASLEDSLWDSLRASLGASLGARLEDSLRASLGASLWASLRASLEDSLRASLGASLWASLRASLRDSLEDSLWDSLRASLGASLGARLEDSLRDSLGASLRDSLEDSLGCCWWGQQDYFWVAFYEWPHDVLSVPYAEMDLVRLKAWSKVARSCGWWWPYRGLCICSERPSRVAMEVIPGARHNQQRLHSDDGAALTFRDGWSVYAIHGVRVPEHVVLRPVEITLKQVKDEQNAEVKRILRERYGEGRFLAEIGAKLVDTDSVLVDRTAPSLGSIERALIEDDEGRRFLVGSDGSTSRTYYMEVPRTVKTCRQAHEALAGMDETKCILQA